MSARPEMRPRPRAGPTQLERVIAAARARDGVCQVDFLGPDVVDGGTPITRLGARVWDAEQRGAVFEILGRRSGFRVYRLVRGPEADSANARAPEHEPPALPLASSASAYDLSNPFA